MYHIAKLSDPSHSVTFHLTSYYVLSTIINSGTECKKYVVCNSCEKTNKQKRQNKKVLKSSFKKYIYANAALLLTDALIICIVA